MTTSEIQLILDTSAVVVYARGSVDVGETISEAGDNGHLFAVHVWTLAEASVLLKPDELTMLDMLLAHPAGAAPLAGVIGWERLARAARKYGSVSRGLVGLAATRHAAYVITADPEAYPGLPTIAI